MPMGQMLCQFHNFGYIAFLVRHYGSTVLYRRCSLRSCVSKMKVICATAVVSKQIIFFVLSGRTCRNRASSKFYFDGEFEDRYINLNCEKVSFLLLKFYFNKCLQLKRKVKDNLRVFHTFVTPYIIYEKKVFYPFKNFGGINLELF